MQDSYQTDNIFARILRGEIPADKVFENKYALAFRDVTPQAPIHILVIPKGAYVTLADFLTRAEHVAHVAFFAAINAVISKLGLTSEGYRIIVNNGGAAHQEVPHLHFHILAGKDLGAMLDKSS